MQEKVYTKRVNLGVLEKQRSVAFVLLEQIMSVAFALGLSCSV